MNLVRRLGGAVMLSKIRVAGEAAILVSPYHALFIRSG
jgi:hypothetical protein